MKLQHFVRYIKETVKRKSPDLILIVFYWVYFNQKRKGIVPFDRSQAINGINVIGLFTSNIGLGKACRMTEELLSRHFPTQKIYAEFDNTAGTVYDVSSEVNDFKYNCNLEIYNPDIHIHMRNTLGNENWNNKYKIGYWVWELEDIPASWIYAHKIYDEIWVPTRFVQKALLKHGIESKVIPYYINQDQSVYRKKQNKEFLFLVMFDLLSSADRKNPLASIQAFLSSKYAGSDYAKLIVKINNGHADPETREKINNLVSDYKNIEIIDKTLSDEETDCLMERVDGVISLHRAEGFGLVLAEAMSKGKIVIATNWSGNLEFMNERNSCLVDCEIVKIDDKLGLYKKNMHWADPDVNHAVLFIDRIVVDKNFRNEISKSAFQYIKDNLSMEKVGSLIESAIGVVA